MKTEESFFNIRAALNLTVSRVLGTAAKTRQQAKYNLFRWIVDTF